MTHRNAPLPPEGRRRLIERCRTRPVAHVAAEMGISRATASKWVNRYRRYGELGLLDQSSAPHRQPTATPGRLVDRIERMRRERKWSASRIAFELEQDGTPVNRRTITRLLAQLGLNRRRFIDPTGETNREPQQIITARPGHMVHIDVKKVGRIQDGGGWRVHGRGSPQAKAVDRTKTRGSRTGYVYLHSAIDGYSRLAYTETLENEKANTAVAFLDRARAWFAAHGITAIERIVTDNGACYRAGIFDAALEGSRHQRITPYTAGRRAAAAAKGSRRTSRRATGCRAPFLRRQRVGRVREGVGSGIGHTCATVTLACWMFEACIRRRTHTVASCSP
jgi:transposase